MNKVSWSVKAFFLTWFIYFTWFWSNAITLDKFGNVWAGHVNIWGDWAAHFTMGSSLAFWQWWPAQSPLLLNQKFSYPFMADWLSAILIRLGVPFWQSFIWPSWLASLCIVAAVFWFYLTWFKNQKTAIISSTIFLLNGGLGWYFFLKDMIASSNWLNFIINIPHEYTRLDDQHIKLINVIDSMIIPQRAFTLGFPISLVALTMMFNWLQQPTKKVNWQQVILVGVILGFMPIIHMHSLLAISLLVSCWWLAKLAITKKVSLTPWWQLALVALPIFFAIWQLTYAGHIANGFMKFFPGWLAKEYGDNWLKFWWLNWGITPILSFIPLLMWAKKPKFAFDLAVGLSFWLLFGLANLWLFQPFAWDNTKIITWASLGISGMVGWLINYLSHQSTLKLVLAGSLLALTLATGVIDAYWIARISQHKYLMYTQEEISLSSWVMANTHTNDVFLTSEKHNHWLFNLTGRRAVMTYRGWLWTHGYKYLPYEQDVRQMFSQPSRSMDLFNKYSVDYIVVGESEEIDWSANVLQLQQNFEVVMRTPSYIIFKTNID